MNRRASAHTHGAIVARYVFGGRPVRVAVAGGAAAAAILRPFEHLRTSDSPDAESWLDIDLRDAEVANEDQARRADGIFEEVTDVSESGRFICQRMQDLEAVFDRRARRVAAAVRCRDEMDGYVRGKPFARLLTEWYADAGVGIVHAGLVASRGRGVLLMGKGGSGKTTLALACARAGLAFLGEDYTAIQFVESGIIGHSVYGSAFIDPPTMAWVPELRTCAQPCRRAGERKMLVLLNDVWPERLAPSVPVRALAICRVADRDRSHVEPISRREALRAAAPSSLLEIHGRRRDSLERVATLVERVAVVRLEIGRDVAAAPDLIDDILHRAGKG